MGCLRYIAYRTLVSLTGNAWLSASSAALQDVYGRGSQAFALASSRVQRCALLAMMAGTYAVRWLRPRPAFGLVALLQLLAAGGGGVYERDAGARAAGRCLEDLLLVLLPSLGSFRKALSAAR